jgi:hypothetical protein
VELNIGPITPTVEIFLQLTSIVERALEFTDIVELYFASK